MKPRSFFVGVLAAAGAVGICEAEVGVVQQQGYVNGRLIVGGAPDEPDPHLHVWQTFINMDSQYTLNPNGDANGDGPAVVGLSVLPGAPPTFVWASQVASGNHDPVYAQFVNGTWTAPIPIATNAGDDLDPQWRQDASGAIHAVWWRAAAGGGGGVVLYATKAPGAPHFSVEEEVSQPGEAARNPSLAVLPSGEVLVAYETDAVNGERWIVTASKADQMAAFAAQFSAATAHSDEVHPVLRLRGEHVLLSWVDSGTAVGYIERAIGGWLDPVAQEGYSVPEETGRARQTALSRVLGP